MMVAPDLVPRKVPLVETRYRRIGTEIPVPQSVVILEELRRYEPVSMSGQPPILWDRAEGLCVFDRWGNRWLDWSRSRFPTGSAVPTPVSKVSCVRWPSGAYRRTRSPAS